jgi:RNA-directed DNA polymerase
VENRVVEMAVRNVIEPIFERDFAPHSYGFRPGRGAKDALRRVQRLLDEGKGWIVDADLKGYFDSIPQEKLEAAVAERIADGTVLELSRRFLKQGVMESGKGWSPTETGTPQGAVLSPLLANIYLNPLDHWMAQKGWEMIRYADDFVILCESQEQAERARADVRQWVEAAGLTLHPTKTRVVDASQRGGFDFLGYHFERGYRWPRQKSLDKFKEAIRAKTRRTRSGSMPAIIEDTNRTLRGWLEYFKHSIGNI